MIEKKTEVTILVSSCDKYEDAWEPFFRLLNIQWPDCPYNIVLSTETKKYNCDFLNVETINSSPQLSWSSRLKNVLTQISTEYVLFFLEDFFLLETVKTDIFELALKLMKSDEKIGLITFNKRSLEAVFPETPDYEHCFLELTSKNLARTNVLVGLWRKDYYLKLIIDGEDPWQYEKNSNIRSKYAGSKIYTQNYEVSFPAFRYCMNPKDGYGITGGKWLRSNREFFESKGIYGINYNNLGTVEEIVTYESIQAANRKQLQVRKQQQKEFLKKLKWQYRLKEYLYEYRKKIKKSFWGQKLTYRLTSIKYFIYYKFTINGH